MKKLLIVAALFYGVYWYASRRFSFGDTLVYAHQRQWASWAQPTDYYAGLVYYQRGDYPKAQEALTQLATDYSTGPYLAKGLMRLSEVAEENRDWPAEREALERFTRDYPDDPEIRLAEKRLELVKFK